MKPILRWHEILQDQRPPLTDEVKARFERGKRIHEAIQRLFPQCRRELSGLYDDPAMPCAISFHADLLEPRSRTLFEIKPFAWWVLNQIYCLRQASGYWQFTEASRAYFLLYEVDHEERIRFLAPVPVERIPWPVLRGTVLPRVRELLAKGAA